MIPEDLQFTTSDLLLLTPHPGLCCITRPVTDTMTPADQQRPMGMGQHWFQVWFPRKYARSCAAYFRLYFYTYRQTTTAIAFVLVLTLTFNRG